jgi:hypothetical protein
VSDCPVCGKAGVPESATRCPQCRADLECFALLDALEEAGQEPVPQADLREVKQAIGRLQSALSPAHGVRVPRLGLLLLAASAALAGPVLVMQSLTLARLPAELPTRVQAREPVATAGAVESLSEDIERLFGRFTSIEGRLDALAAEQAESFERVSTAAGQMAELGRGRYKETARPSAEASPVVEGAAPAEAAAPVEKAPELVLHHHLRPGETLWSIAKRYYGKGHLYPVLIAQNPGLGVNHSGTGVLRIFADPADALELYRRITPPGAEGRLFRYRVQPGDNWRELARRFLGRASRAPELMALNPMSNLTPGKQVLIALE